MRLTGSIVALGLAAGCAVQEPVAGPAGELANGTAGAAMDCVNLRDLRGNRSVEGGAILFETGGSLVYVNRPLGGCPSLALGRALQTRTSTGRLCRGDIVTVFDPVSNAQFGGCALGDFTPYRRAR